MPAIDTRLAPNPAALESSPDSAADDVSGTAGAAGDFDFLVQALAAPRSQKMAGALPLPMQNNSRAEKPMPASGSATPVCRKEHTDGTLSGKIDGNKKKSSSGEGETSTDTKAVSATAMVPEAPPALLSLPLFLSASLFEPATSGTHATPVATAPQAENSGVPQTVSAAAGPAQPPQARPASHPISEALQRIPNLAEKFLSEAPGKELRENGTPALEAAKKSAADSAAKMAAKVADTSNVSTSSQPAGTTTESTTGDPISESDETTISQTMETAPHAALDASQALSYEEIAANSGMGVASTSLPMKNPPKTNNVAGSEAQVLPVNGNGQGRVKKLSARLAVTPVGAAENRGADFTFAFANGTTQPTVRENAPSLNSVDLPSLADARMRAVDRAHDMMVLHTMRLVESKSNSLSVVIKPAVGTEMSLELHLGSGGIEAQATVTRGDREFLSQHWPELQQRLDQRGVKLAPLGGETSFTAGNNGHSRQEQTSQEDVAQQAAAFAEFAAAGNAGGATARLATVHDGWESWA